MERPENVYLPEPITLHGMPVRYTAEGARYLKEHWQHVYNTVPDKLTDKAQILRMIEVYNQTLELYAKA
jgi:hypothetical protein